jgi:hypothetical protein
MDQETAARLSREMAQVIAGLYRDEQVPVGQDLLDRFKSAAFYQAYEFIPDGAPAIVLSAEEGPLLVAVEGDRFYKLSFADFVMTEVTIPATVCEMQRIRPEVATLSVQTLYQQIAAGVMARITTWAFSLDGGASALAFKSEQVYQREQSEQERFARALTAALDWPGPGEISPP